MKAHTQFLKGKVALITGAGHETGRSIAVALASQGAVVAVNDISPVNLDDTVALVAQKGGTVKDYVADVSKKIAVQGVVTAVLDDWGRLDMVIHCANVEPSASILDMDEWDLQRAINVNLGGTFLMTQIAGRVMKEQGGGVIVHIIRWKKSSEHAAAAYASKLGAMAFANYAAREFRDFNVRVHAIGEWETKDLPGGFSPPIPACVQSRFADIPSLVLDLVGGNPSVMSSVICLPVS